MKDFELIEEAKKLIQDNNFNEAKKILLTVKTDNKEALFELGKISFIEDDSKNAIKYLYEAYKLSCKDVNIMDLLFKSYKLQNKTFRALRILFRLRKTDYNESDNEIISLYIDKERYDLAIKYIYKYLDDSCNDIKRVKKYLLLQLAKLNICGRFYRAKAYASRILKYINRENNIKFYNSVLNELEIAEGRVFLKSYPRRMTVTLTSACNLRCLMCPYDKDNKRELSYKQVKEIISFLPYLEEIEWNGGEVFLYKYFNILIDNADKFNVKQYITSNGLLINDAYAEKIVRYSVDLTLSIDSVDKELYEKIRKNADFNLLLSNIEKINYYRKLLNKDITIFINSVLSRWNYKNKKNFLDIIAFAKKYDFKTVRISMDLYDKDHNFMKDIVSHFNTYKSEISSFANEQGIDFICIVPETYDVANNLKTKNSIYEFSGNKNMDPTSKYMEKSFTHNFEDIRNYEYKVSQRADRLSCVLPFKKLVMSFKADYKNECVCPELGHISKSNLLYIRDNIFYWTMCFLNCFSGIDTVRKTVECIKEKCDYVPLPVSRTLQQAWNSDGMVRLRIQTLKGRLKCLDVCYLPENIKYNI